ncbi:hypothetical protein SH668x_000934 [Planctomicrobium sp. SH668]|uniref:hypothetical protein n=1 Tax=Planctomicrobium sp. SH668 TaxID=3448126 RepID=UPI003F5BD607
MSRTQFDFASCVPRGFVLLASCALSAVASPAFSQEPTPAVHPSIEIVDDVAPIDIPPAPSFDPEEQAANSDDAELNASSTGGIAIPPMPSLDLVPPEPSRDEKSAVSPEEEGSENDEWTIQIRPLAKPAKPVIAANYEAIYASIPYRRAEYLANPSYRHDTTVELLFGTMRNTVINRHDTPERIQTPIPQFTQPYPISQSELYSYWPLIRYEAPVRLMSPIY